MSYGRKWQTTSKAWIQRYPLCVWCLVHGQINAGATANAAARQRSLVVDHIEPHHGDDALMWDYLNYETLCRYPCHDRYKRQWEFQHKDGMSWLLELKRTMEANKTQAFVEQHAQYLPPTLIDMLLPRVGGSSSTVLAG